MKKFYIIVSLVLLSFISNAQIINIADANFKTALLNHSPAIDINDDNEIQLTEALATTMLFANDANISNLTGIDAFSNLTYLDVSGNNLTTIDVSALVSISTLNASSNQLTSINLGNANNLYSLGLNNNQLTALDLSGKTIVMFSCMNNLLTNINLTGADIHEFRCQNNQLIQLNLNDLVNLTEFYCTNNGITSIEFYNNVLLNTVDCTLNPITQLDFSQNPDLFDLDCLNPILQSINLKNGGNNEIFVDYYDDGASLRYVCTDEEDIAYFTNYFNAFYPLVHVSSYCSFSPGGKYNTITGTVRFDIGNDGCVGTDPVVSHLRLNLTNAIGGAGTAFTDNTSGQYNFFTMTGNFTVVPVPPSPYYTFTPVSPVITFTNTNHNTTVQDFCMIPSGIHQDLEITMVSTLPARPGFEAEYILHYKNKGTETMSGTVNLQFNDNLMDFVISNPAIGTQATGMLGWTYTNLLPFETRSITVTMSINTPTETPAVNIGDPLDFTATVFPVAGDETPLDNVFQLRQFVVGSFDPNDITCQEGETIGLSQVGEYLHYLIRFQNSGTFYAENVVVKNIINDPNFDLSTLEIIGSSHPQVARLTDNTLEFIFEGINLPAEGDDEPGSHGYIAYKIRTTNTLNTGDSVSQVASIFFDFNFPIITNTAVTTVTALGVNQYEISAIAIYPNPAKNVVTVSSNDIIKKVSLYDLQGRLLGSQYAGSGNLEMDISKRSRGVYLLKVETNNGITTERLIKE